MALEKVDTSNKIKLRPLRGRIMIQIDSFVYTGKLIIPDAAKRLPSTGVVVAVGEGVSQVTIGDRLCVPMYSGTSLAFRDKQTQKDLPPYRMLTEDEVLGVLSDDIELTETGA